MGSSSPGRATSTTTSGPPSWLLGAQKTFLNDVLGNVNSNLSQGMPSGLNQQVQPFSANQQTAIDYGQANVYPNVINGVNQLTPQILQQINGVNPQAKALASQGANTLGGIASGSINSGLNPSLNKFAQGNFVGSNPYLNSMFNQAANQDVQQYVNAIQPSLQAQFQQAGAFNSPGFQLAQGQAEYGLNQGLGTLGANLYGNAYQQDMSNMLTAAQSAQQNTQFNVGNQLNAAQSAGQGINALYAPAGNRSNLGYGALGQQGQLGGQGIAGLYGLGSAQQQQGQNILNANQANTAQQTNWPYAILSQLGGALGQAALGGGTQTATGPAPQGGK